MVARIHLTNMPLVEDGKIYRRIFGGYGLSVAAIPYFKSHLVCFCYINPGVDRVLPHQTSGLEWEFSDMQITMHLTGSTLYGLKWASSFCKWHE